MTPFIQTMTELQYMLQDRLKSPYRKISVDGSNAPNKVTLCFTIFSNNGYKLAFATYKNFRMYRLPKNPNGPREEVLAHFENERKLLLDIVNQLTSGCLNPYLNDTPNDVDTNS